MSSSKLLTKPTIQWCDLPVDPCSIIISRLDVMDIMNLSSTCRTWASICNHLKVTILTSGKPTLVTSQPDQDGFRIEDDLTTGKFGIHDVSKGISFCCVKKGLQGRSWVGDKDDWLVTSNSKLVLELLNPITGSTVSLPSFNNNHNGLRVDDYREMRATYVPFSRFLRRVVLSRTPTQPGGYDAIALFSVGLLAYTAEGQNVWRVLKNPSDHDDNPLNYYLEVYFAVIVCYGWVIAVDDDGSIYAWNMNDHSLMPMQLPAPDTHPSKDSMESVFYLAISPANQLVLVSLHGHNSGIYFNRSSRMVLNEHDRFEHLDRISVHEFDSVNETWRRIPTVGHDQSLFIGLNYPFYVSSEDFRDGSVYVADLAKNDSVICSMEREGVVYISKQDFPVDETTRLLDGYSIRTPMWFRPTAPARARDKM